MNKILFHRKPHPRSPRKAWRACFLHPVPVRRYHQRGLALITAVLVVAIVATVAASMGLGQQIWLRQAQNFNDRAQAEKMAQGALHVAMLILAEDAKKNNNSTDDLTEDWARDLPPFSAQGGATTIKILDAQGRFNLNSLMEPGGVVTRPGEIAVFKRLLESLALNPELTDALLDWMDANDQPTLPAGAEDIYYLTLPAPYRTANKPLQSVDELRLVRGFDAKTVDLLRPYVTALPPQTNAVNINTAEARVLSVLFSPPLSLATAQELVERRNKDRNPFKNPGELTTRASGKSPAVIPGVKSNYFYVEVQTLFGRLHRSRRALIDRSSSTGPTILWQESLSGPQPQVAAP